MFAYRHLFHAGNFADVFKHAVLTRLLIHLNRKDKPWFYLDTHAGLGGYDLTHEWAQKNAEHAAGIVRVWKAAGAPAELTPYLDIVRAVNTGDDLRFYPGSPWIAHSLARATDRLVCNEINPDDCAELRALFEGQRRVHVHDMDGYQALKAFLPPPERRGLVLIDSAFDQAQEFKRLAEAVAQGHRRWATGIYAVWYPHMDARDVHSFEQRFVHAGIRKILRLSLSVHPEHWNEGLRGSSLLVINPPWGLEEEARRMLPWLWRQLSPAGHGGWQVEWLMPE